jgi:hypothetical protein
VLTAVALSVTALSAPASAANAPTQAACIREGLAPIPVTLRAGAEYAGARAGTPVFQVDWSGKPLAVGCHARRAVAINFTMWFPHLRFVYTEGFPIHFLEFWNGRKEVRGGRESYVSGASYRPLRCILKARAKLRYEVIAPGGAILGKRIVPAPVKLLPCSE